MKSLTSLELFTGAGGLALGLEAAGWRHTAVVEKNPHACATIRLNQTAEHPLMKGWMLHEADVRSIKYESIAKSVDMVAGGPPCQPFSMGGKHRAHGDPRDMFPEAVRAVRELQPCCFVFENVKGLLRESFATYFGYVVLQLTYPSVVRRSSEEWRAHLRRLERTHTSGRGTDLQYRVVYQLLNAAEYGVPQNRERVFIVGFRSDLNREWSFPAKTHSLDRLLYEQWVTGSYWEEHEISKRRRPTLKNALVGRVARLKSDFSFVAPPGRRYRTVRDALQGLPDPQNATVSITNHEYRPGARSYAGHTGSGLDEPCKVLKAGDHGVPGGENMLVMPTGKVRYFTVRESARIQAFPDEYIFSGSWTEAMRQIGNAVPVVLASAVGRSIRKQVL